MRDCVRETGLRDPELQALDEEEKKWLVRIAIAQLPEEQIAQRFGVCRGAIYWRLQSIKKRLRFRVLKLAKECAA